MHERGLPRPLATLRELVLARPAAAHGEPQLVAQRRLEHLRSVGVEAEADLVLLEDRDELAELLRPLHDLGVQIRAGADLEQDAALRQALAEARVLGRM